MAQEINERKVQEAVRSGFKRMKRFQRARALFIRAYVGQYYAADVAHEGDQPLNMLYHTIRSLVPNYVMRNPTTQVTTDIADFRTYAFMLGMALNNLNQQQNLKMTIRRAIVDSFFAMGIVTTGLSATDQLVDFGDIRVDPGQVYSDTVDFDEFVIDPSCRLLEESAFMGHRMRIPRQILLDDEECDHDLVMRLPKSEHPDARNKAAALSKANISEQEMIELQDFVDVVSLYIPGAGSSILVPDPDQLISDGYIKLTNYYGPKTGPYRFLTLTQPVPGNPFPVAPVGIWYDLAVMCNRLMRKQMIRAENQKTLYVVDPSAPDQAEDMREAEDQEVVFGNPDSVEMFSSKGAEQGTDHTLSNLQMWFNYMSGNPDQMAGVQSNANTATQATILEGNANVTVEDSRGMVYDFAAGIISDRAWYLHYDPLIDLPFTVRKKELSEVTGEFIRPEQYNFPVQMRLTPEQRRGEHFHYTFKIKPRSMSAIDPLVLSRRIVEFATNVVPAVITAAAAALQMGVPFNVQRAITTIANQLELSDEVQDWFDDPEFQDRLNLMMMMGPQPEGKALNIQGIRQNGGFPGQVSFGANPMNQQAQELAGVAQTAMKGSIRGRG